ncbi:TIGR04255 family protein [Flavobacterium branchiicola]|uniref:TIGR04255 family protein n=1 Tax=Flavobacterium branchiicola TaxID=1114875 RepID=A0ABV9PF88_9FLAO|nr:TIGR04255 family protein [Flavobacterium branchiicola]MBS7254563.1 TIGR04255 family protein [Flavobacterium branchiicola]
MYPTKITPNPLVSSTIEIRFKSEVEHDSIFKLFYGKLSDTLPKLENTNFPRKIRLKNSELKYYPDHILSNTDYSVSFNENFISFENITEYQLWKSYKNSFKNILELILESKVIDTIERIGIRYQSRFDNENFAEILKETPSMKIEDLKENFIMYTTKISTDDFDLLVQLKKDITEKTFNSDEPKGHLIDIDVFKSNNVAHVDICNYIDSAHTLLKRTFFGLLKDDFIKTLNPEY